MAPVAGGMMWMDDHTYTHMGTVVPIHCFGMKTKSLSRPGRPRTCMCWLCPVAASSLHPAPVFQPFVHVVFSLTSRSGIRGTLLLKHSVRMPSPSQRLLVYDQRKGPRLESFPESQASSKFSLVVSVASGPSFLGIYLGSVLACVSVFSIGNSILFAVSPATGSVPVT